MDCIRAYISGVPNVLATSGTAFTETQVRLLGRFTRRVVVNFDPDTAGANAAEKSIALLVEEGFEVKVLTLEDGLDPDRYIRERGAKEYVAALRAAPRHTDYLIERARKLFPPRTAENKVKAVNFLLPHMRRIHNRIARDEFVTDAAQKLGVDSMLLRQELKEAAAAKNRGAGVPSAETMSEAERLLLRALLLDAGDPIREAARRAVLSAPHLFEGIGSGPLLQQLATPESAPDLHAIECSDKERAMLARLMLDAGLAPTGELVEDSARTLELRGLERRQRELRTEIAAAERASDPDAYRALCEEKLELDRRIREM
jgi:DNA primase